MQEGFWRVLAWVLPSTAWHHAAAAEPGAPQPLQLCEAPAGSDRIGRTRADQGQSAGAFSFVLDTGANRTVLTLTHLEAEPAVLSGIHMIRALDTLLIDYQGCEMQVRARR